MSPRKEKLPEALSHQLYDKEDVIWWGQPIASHLAMQVNVMNIVVNIAVAAFALFFYTFARDMMAGSSFGTSSFGALGVVVGVIVVLCFHWCH